MAHSLFLLLDQFYSLPSVVVVGVICFVVGTLLRLAIVAKHKKKILKLEDEMLDSHSRILTLEKKINDLENENTELLKFSPRKVDLKVS